MLNRIRKSLQDAKEKRERERQQQEEARSLKLQQQAELERQQQAAIEEEEQLQQNILSILHVDKLPAIEWNTDGSPLPFKFLKSEHLIFVFANVGYAEQRVKREIVGRSAGTSIRVAKGVSIRAGASRGTPVERDEVVARGEGMLAITNKHVYFSGQRSFRIRFDKIVSVKPMLDAVEVTRDRASALSEYFLVGEHNANFAYELLQAIPSLDLPRNPETENPIDYHLLILHGDVGGDQFHE